MNVIFGAGSVSDRVGGEQLARPLDDNYFDILTRRYATGIMRLSTEGRPAHMPLLQRRRTRGRRFLQLVDEYDHAVDISRVLRHPPNLGVEVCGSLPGRALQVRAH